MQDLYFELNYGRLYEKIEKGVCEVFGHQSQFGSVQHMFIKRPIPIQIDGQVYYDLVTPYGYGGPLMAGCKEENKGRLAKEFEAAFQKYCHTHHIVSEFVRFHPIIENAADFKDCYELSLKRYTIGTNLKNFEDPVQAEFSKSAKVNYKKALKDGVEYRVTVNPKSLDLFKEFYYDTLRKNNADAIYFFDDQYFSDMLKYFGQNLLLVEALYEGKVIGMVLNFIYKKIIHIHLSGTVYKYLHLSPVYVMMYALTCWGKENGYDLIHSGGGREGKLDDQLYLFKKRFGSNTQFDFYVGQKVWNLNIYDELRKISKAVKIPETFLHAE